MDSEIELSFEELFTFYDVYNEIENLIKNKRKKKF